MEPGAHWVVYQTHLQYLDFFLDCLLSREQDNNYSLVMQIAYSVRCCFDPRAPESDAIYKLAELLTMALQHHYQGKDFSHSKEIGAISLPTGLFQRRDNKLPKLRSALSVSLQVSLLCEQVLGCGVQALRQTRQTQGRSKHSH